LFSIRRHLIQLVGERAQLLGSLVLLCQALLARLSPGLAEPVPRLPARLRDNLFTCSVAVSATCPRASRTDWPTFAVSSLASPVMDDRAARRPPLPGGILPVF
jgi:hypothetical protein